MADEKKRPPGIMFYEEMLETFDKLPDESVGRLVKAAYRLHFLDETEPDFGDDKMTADILWPIVRDRVLRNIVNYNCRIDDKRLAGYYSEYKRQEKEAGRTPLSYKVWKSECEKKQKAIDTWNVAANMTRPNK